MQSVASRTLKAVGQRGKGKKTGVGFKATEEDMGRLEDIQAYMRQKAVDAGLSSLADQIDKTYVLREVARYYHENVVMAAQKKA